MSIILLHIMKYTPICLYFFNLRLTHVRSLDYAHKLIIPEVFEAHLLERFVKPQLLRCLSGLRPRSFFWGRNWCGAAPPSCGCSMDMPRMPSFCSRAQV